MIGWLIGIGLVGFAVSLYMASAMRPRGVGGAKWWGGAISIAVFGVGLALLFAWPMWLLGELVAPFVDVSTTTGGAILGCIFGLGGAALTGVLSVSYNERFANASKR